MFAGLKLTQDINVDFVSFAHVRDIPKSEPRPRQTCCADAVPALVKAFPSYRIYIFILRYYGIIKIGFSFRQERLGWIFKTPFVSWKSRRKELRLRLRSWSLQNGGGSGVTANHRRSNRGRKSMESEEREEVSLRMKKYWAKHQETGNQNPQ